MKRFMLLLIVCCSIIIVSCGTGRFFDTTDVDDKYVKATLPPGATNIEYTGKPSWFTFDRNNKHWLLYCTGGDTNCAMSFIIEDTNSKLNADINNPDDGRFYDVVSVGTHKIYFNSYTFHTELKEYDDLKDVYYVRSYIQYKLDTTDDVVHLEVYDSNTLKYLYTHSKDFVIFRLKQGW
jgi:hypothetical protein